MKIIQNLIFCVLLMLAVSGCATIKLITSVQTQGYNGVWLPVDVTKTNAPSGEHLLNLLCDSSAKIRLIVSQYGTPNFIRYNDINVDIYKVSFVFIDKNQLITYDKQKDNQNVQALDRVYEAELPPQYIIVKEKNEEEKRRQLREEQLTLAKKEQAEREAENKVKIIQEQNKQTERATAEEAEKKAEEEETLKQKEAQAKEVAEATKLFDLNILTKRADAQKGKTLVFKKFYLGMPFADCLQLINNSMELPQTLPIPRKDPSETADANKADNPEVYLKNTIVQLFKAQNGDNEENEPYRVYSRAGKSFIAKNIDDKPFAMVEASGLISSFQLSPEVLNKLFDAKNIPKEEFLQSFIDNYGIPKLEPDTTKVTFSLLGTTEEIGYQNVLRYRDPKGYEVIYHDLTMIENEAKALLSETPPEGTISIRKIKTEQERKAKFD